MFLTFSRQQHCKGSVKLTFNSFCHFLLRPSRRITVFCKWWSRNNIQKWSHDINLLEHELAKRIIKPKKRQSLWKNIWFRMQLVVVLEIYFNHFAAEMIKHGRLEIFHIGSLQNKEQKHFFNFCNRFRWKFILNLNFQSIIRHINYIQPISLFQFALSNLFLTPTNDYVLEASVWKNHSHSVMRNVSICYRKWKPRLEKYRNCKNVSHANNFMVDCILVFFSLIYTLNEVEWG